jgi:hypothetical protein
VAKGTLDDIDEMRREVRQAVAQHGGGHATLFPAPSEMRAEISVFEPQPKALAGLSRRLKAAFDPYAILEPRRSSLARPDAAPFARSISKAYPTMAPA